MEGEQVVNKILMEEKSSSSSPTGLPINWSLITGPVPEPVFTTSSLSSFFPLSQTSAVHSLQTKVKTFSQRKPRGRDKDKERKDPDVQEVSLYGIAPEVYLRPKEKGKSQVAVCVPSWQVGGARNLSTSDEDQEVEVQVKLEIHSPPAEAQMLTQGTHKVKENSPVKEKKQVTLEQSKSLESLLPDHSFNGKNETSLPLQAPPVSTFSISSRHWAPPKGFWRIARPETLILNGVSSALSTLPIMDYTKIDEKQKKPEGTATKGDVGVAVDDADAPSGLKHSDSMECYLDRCEKDVEAKGLCISDSWESTISQSVFFPTDDKLRAKPKAFAKLRERLQSCKEENGQSGETAGQNEDAVDRKDTSGHSDCTDSAILPQELEPYLRSLLVINDDLPLSPRHEQAKRLLERARLKARSNHIKCVRVSRRSHSDQRDAISKKQQTDSPSPTRGQKAVQTKEDISSQTGPLLIPNQRDTSPSEQEGRARRYGCSPTRVRFEDESEKEAETRYLDRVRQRGRPRNRESNIDSTKNQRGVCLPLSQNNPVSVETQTVVREIIVLVKKCEACGSVVRETQSVTSPSDKQNTDSQQTTNSEDLRSKQPSRHTSVNKPETSTRPKASLTVTFAGAYVLGENREISTGWKSSGFGKLRRRSRKGESRIESGHGPYGPSWAQRRNSNPRNRANISRGVTFAPGSPVALEPRLLEASGGVKESTGPALPIKSALKSSTRKNLSQSTVQFQVSSSQGAEAGSLQDCAEVRRESPGNQGSPGTSSPVPCIRPSTLRYSPARLSSDLPAADLWDATPDGPAGGDAGPGTDCRPVLRTLAVSRADDLRAELLRAEHLKAEAIWEENSDGTRKLDGRPKLFLRRFFSSIGLNSVGRLVKGARSSSMEQLSIPPAPRASSASPSPTRRPQPTIRIQRTPSLQALNTVFPLAQLRKASSVQSLERRTERSTILGEVQIPYGLAPSPDSPQLDLHRALSVENVLVSRMVRPVGRVTQAFPDGTLLLELTRPPNGPFGFVICRGKGRPDTGVYVEKVGDGSGEGLYMGLLGIGDEILQVNGEAVAGLSLDQVTRLMTRDSTACLRIMPARRIQRLQ